MVAPVSLLFRLMGVKAALLTMLGVGLGLYLLGILFSLSFFLHLAIAWVIYCSLSIVVNTLRDLTVLDAFFSGIQPLSHQALEQQFTGLLLAANQSLLAKRRGESRKDQDFADRVSEIGYSAGELEHNTQQLADNIAQQSESTRSVAAAVTEISYSIEEIVQRIQGAYQAATHVSELSDQGAKGVQAASQNVASVADYVRSTNELLGSLAKQTLEISSMSSVIRDMAEQTNLLALNAAIEAARAGEYGRGFAVVADEVRALANRSHDSAKIINTPIDDVQQQVVAVSAGMDKVVACTEASVSNTQEADATLQSIKQCTAEVSDMLYAISSATEQQSGAVREISSNIESVAEIAAGNSDIASQSATIAQHLCHLCAPSAAE